MRDALRDEMIKKICIRDADNILDVGCGDGTFLHELTRWKDVEGYGIDESEDKILIAKQTWPELHFETGYSDFLSFDDNSFRVITVCDDFHTFKDPQKFVNEAFRVLIPGGRLYIGESALPDALRIVSNIPSYLTAGDNRRHSTYETLGYFKNAGLTKRQISQAKFRPDGITRNGVRCRVTETIYPGDVIRVCLEEAGTASAHLENYNDGIRSKDLSDFHSNRASASISETSFSFSFISSSTYNRYPLSEGILPAEVWGCTIYPISVRSDISFRMVAELTFKSANLEMVREPTGSPVSM